MTAYSSDIRRNAKTFLERSETGVSFRLSEFRLFQLQPSNSPRGLSRGIHRVGGELINPVRKCFSRASFSSTGWCRSLNSLSSRVLSSGFSVLGRRAFGGEVRGNRESDRIIPALLGPILAT